MPHELNQCIPYSKVILNIWSCIHYLGNVGFTFRSKRQPCCITDNCVPVFIDQLRFDDEDLDNESP